MASIECCTHFKYLEYRINQLPFDMFRVLIQVFQVISMNVTSAIFRLFDFFKSNRNFIHFFLIEKRSNYNLDRMIFLKKRRDFSQVMGTGFSQELTCAKSNESWWISSRLSCTSWWGREKDSIIHLARRVTHIDRQPIWLFRHSMARCSMEDREMGSSSNVGRISNSPPSIIIVDDAICCWGFGREDSRRSC